MSRLIDLDCFAPIRDHLLQAGAIISASGRTVTLVAPTTLTGAISLALIEASLVDSALPYNRRFAPRAPPQGAPSIVIEEGDSISAPHQLGTDPLSLRIAPMIVTALAGHRGDPRSGRLSPVASAAALGECIGGGARARRIRPWLVAGNWLHQALDQTYDPVYTSLRDHLLAIGAIQVVPMPEVPLPCHGLLPSVDEHAAEALRIRWPSLDLEGRARAISHLIRPSLVDSQPSTARLEELGWHRLLATDWSRDLASQLHLAEEAWRGSGGSLEHADLVVDGLLRNGCFQ